MKLRGRDYRSVALSDIRRKPLDALWRKLRSFRNSRRCPTKIDRSLWIVTWGKADKGVRADLTLDKQTYPLGQDVPLHIATEDTGAVGPVFDERFGHHMGETGMYALPYSFLVTIEDEHGQPIKAKQLLWSGSFRPQPCPTAYTKNIPLPREVSLADFGLLPDKPGIFRVFYTWDPYTTEYPTCDDVPMDPQVPDPAFVPEPPFAKAISNVQTIRIVEANAVP